MKSPDSNTFYALTLPLEESVVSAASEGKVPSVFSPFPLPKTSPRCARPSYQEGDYTKTHDHLVNREASTLSWPTLEQPSRLFRYRIYTDAFSPSRSVQAVASPEASWCDSVGAVFARFRTGLMGNCSQTAASSVSKRVTGGYLRSQPSAGEGPNFRGDRSKTFSSSPCLSA